MVLRTVRSLGSCFRTFSYSAMAFCSLPCCTNFSAALRIFVLLEPKPSAIMESENDNAVTLRQYCDACLRSGTCGLQPQDHRRPGHTNSLGPRRWLTLPHSWSGLNQAGP